MLPTIMDTVFTWGEFTLAYDSNIFAICSRESNKLTREYRKTVTYGRNLVVEICNDLHTTTIVKIRPKLFNKIKVNLSETDEPDITKWQIINIVKFLYAYVLITNDRISICIDVAHALTWCARYNPMISEHDMLCIENRKYVFADPDNPRGEEYEIIAFENYVQCCSITLRDMCPFESIMVHAVNKSIANCAFSLIECFADNENIRQSLIFVIIGILVQKQLGDSGGMGCAQLYHLHWNELSVCEHANWLDESSPEIQFLGVYDSNKHINHI